MQGILEPIKLQDGTELVPLENSEKEALEAEIKVVLDKYNAMYLPAIKKEESITHTTQRATLFLLKKKQQGVPSNNKEVNPLLNGESDDTKEETPEAN